MDFYQHAGKMALGSRLRRLSDRFAEDAATIYKLYGVPLDPKWFPIVYVLSHQSEASITEIAKIVGQSHPAVSQTVKEMLNRGVVITDKHTDDARVTVVKLSEEGKRVIPLLEVQLEDVSQAAQDLLSETQHDLWKAIAEVEFLLDQQSFLDRVRATRQVRESQAVEILDYAPEFQADFKRLNCEWIEHYFTLEPEDHLSLDHPDEKILGPGGHIFMARYKGDIVGTCALIKLDDSTYELAKMAVTARARGRGIGWQLGQAAIAKARDLGAHTLHLDSNTVLEPAIKLYQKLGFQKVVGKPSLYERCNIQMELQLV